MTDVDEPMTERDAARETPPRDHDATRNEADDVDQLPAEAVEEARRWQDVPMDEPEESTGTDV